MEKEQGAFISLEGIDGSGKSTQLKLLSEKLRKDGYDVLVIDFPRYDEPSGYFAREYMKGTYGQHETVSPYAASVLFALDHYQAGLQIRGALSQGKIILADRFTGSNMAYQGMKFAHAEERRGFYIWLDNLEFRMLGIPRPQRNLVMNIPPEHALKLHESRGTSEDHSKAQLASTAEIYLELCQLFPKDFTCIDCVRSDKLLSSEQIHEMIWKTVEPFLPAKPKQASAKTDDLAEDVQSEEKTTSMHEVVLQDISVQLASKIATSGMKWHEEPAEGRKHLRYYIPKALDKKIQTSYKEAMDTFLEIHARIANSPAKQFAGHILPLARLASGRISGEPAAFQRLYDDLVSSALPEAQDAARQIAAQIESLKTKERPARPAAELQETHGTNGGSVKLIGVWPRKELDLLPHLLYNEGSSSFREIEAQVTTWPIAKKIEIFQSRLRTRGPQAFAQVVYGWDLVADFETLRHLLGKVNQVSIDAQASTPRLGYDIPKEIEQADLSDAYEACFDLSARLHSILQSGDHSEEAAYAVLGGHRVRFKMSATAENLVHIFAATDEIPGLHALTGEMQDKLIETHPMLAERIAKDPDTA